MAKKGGKQPGAGKPKKKISQEDLDKAGNYAKVQSNDTMIEKLMSWSDGFIGKRKDISRYIQQKRAEGKQELLNTQFSMQKQPTMAIWLGKQHLGQADKQDQHHTFEEIKVAI